MPFSVSSSKSSIRPTPASELKNSTDGREKSTSESSTLFQIILNNGNGRLNYPLNNCVIDVEVAEMINGNKFSDSQSERRPLCCVTEDLKYIC